MHLPSCVEPRQMRLYASYGQDKCVSEIIQTGSPGQNHLNVCISAEIFYRMARDSRYTERKQRLVRRRDQATT